MGLREEAEEIRWRHTIDLGRGFIVKGTKDTFFDLNQFKFPEGFFKGKTVLDVGACDGFFSFHAEQQGATDVFAIDPYRWTFDDRWSGQRGFNFSRQVLNSKVRDSVIPLEEISEETFGKFDIVLFLGVFYHLPNPFQSKRSNIKSM